LSYTSLVGSFVYKDPVFASKLDTLAENDDFLKDNGWATSTKTAFFQASAPTGWTKDITAALDGKILRVVSGAGGGTGGSFDIAGTITLNHTNSISASGTHYHTQSHYHHQEYDTISDADGLIYARVKVDSPGRFQNIPTGGGAETYDLMEFGAASDERTSTLNGNHNHGGSLTAQLTNITLTYIDIIICTKDTSSGYTDITDTFIHNKKIDFDEFDEDLADNDKYNYDRLTPSGSIAIFGQQNAPTGWTKLTTQNDAALRVETGTGGGTGGSSGFGQLITLQHNHTGLSSADGSHTHSSSHGHRQNFSNDTAGNAAASQYFVIDGSDHLQRYDGTAVTLNAINPDSDGVATTLLDSGTHTHTIGNSLTNITLAYFDVIQCSKDSTGSSSVYTDLTAEFAYKKLVSKQRLNKLAANDDYVNYHTIPSASVSFFYQASAPLTWTKLTTQNDKGLRIVSGSTGGTGGGSQAISSTITLAHTHTISSDGHNHSLSAHSHSLVGISQSNVGAAQNLWILVTFSPDYGNECYVDQRTGSATGYMVKKTFESTVRNGSVDTNNHNHSGVSGSSLSNIILAYADVILCTKN